MENKDQRLLPDKQYFKIGEVSELVGVDPHVLRYWEAEFKIIKPLRAGSRQRLYRRNDVENLLRIRELLYDQGYTIAGARQALKVVAPVVNSGKDKDGGTISSEFVGSLKHELYELMRLLED